MFDMMELPNALGILPGKADYIAAMERKSSDSDGPPGGRGLG